MSHWAVPVQERGGTHVNSHGGRKGGFIKYKTKRHKGQTQNKAKLLNRHNTG